MPAAEPQSNVRASSLTHHARVPNYGMATAMFSWNGPRVDFDISAVLDRFFEMPDHFRIGMGVNTEMFAEGLNRISQALPR